MLRKILPALCMILLSAPAVGADIDGMWLRGDGNARVRIARCGGQVCVTNVWIRNPKSQGEAVGDQLVMSLSQQPDGSLAGQAHNARRNLTMSLNITTSPGQFTSRGCVVGGLLCRTETWTAVR